MMQLRNYSKNQMLLFHWNYVLNFVKTFKV